MVTSRVAKGTALGAVVILIAMLSMFTGHGESNTAEAVDPLTVGLDMKVNLADPGIYSTLPTFDKCVDVNTAVGNGIFYFDLFVLNVTQLQSMTVDMTFNSPGMHILAIDGNKFLANGTSTSVLLAGGSLDSSGNVTSPAGGLGGGNFAVTVFDQGGGHTGSGALIRFKGQGNVVTGGALINMMINHNPSQQKGITMANPIPQYLGDTTGDNIFDGPFNPSFAQTPPLPATALGKIAVNGPDQDGDGFSGRVSPLFDGCDNCPGNSNPTQLNTDGDALGDACDPDDDNDGIADGSDTCPTVYDPTNNPASCLDSDGDGIFNGSDNCPNDSNANQANNDGDSMGDVCDPDDDNDGVLDGPDNCDFIANPGQENWNGNAFGDACEDADGDGWMDNIDNCKQFGNPAQTNSDGDLYGDICDNCPTTPNNAQADVDGDLLGDHCDDSDNDPGNQFAKAYDNEEIYNLTSWNVRCSADTIADNEGSPNRWNDAWPPDMNDTRNINGQDLLKFNNIMNQPVTNPPVYVPGLSVSTSGPHPPRQRFDLNGNGTVNGQDWLFYTTLLGTTCVP